MKVLPKTTPISNLLLGKPLKSSDERGEQIGALTGIPIFGLDALSSAGYGPEAALTLLLVLGAAGLHYIIPITGAIILLLTIVYFSYLQTIAAYPTGGGSYTVARENLGESAGQLAAAALMIDYVLTVSVGISAGVGALVSAFPPLLPHTLAICLGILSIIALINLRGLREVGKVFIVPTYLFVGSLLMAIVLGIGRVVMSRGHPLPVIAPHPLASAAGSLSAWLLLQAFASGCTAMTGVEAVSNGVRAFRPPETRNAQLTLTIIIGILIVLLAGIGYLSNVFHIGATPAGQPGYESVLSQMVSAVAGKGVFYFIAMGSILLVLCLSANTAFADFPRLCQVVAVHKSLPTFFASRGRRLVFSQGIVVLTVFAGLLLVIFGGVTDRLIPLYAVGAFLAFTLSQAGMVLHWKNRGGRGAARSMLMNGLGATATFITVLVVLIAKFVEGAWITFLLIPTLVLVMKGVARQYARVGSELASNTPLQFNLSNKPLVILPVAGWDKATKKALCFAFSLSDEIKVIHIEIENDRTRELKHCWDDLVVVPARAAGMAAPQLEIRASPYRRILTPIVEIALREAGLHPDRAIAVIIPEIVERRWYNYLLHNQRAAVLKTMLYFQGRKNIVVVNVPWYVEAGA
ncbi:MAG: APC family permease [Acidobacteria bacterium]|nr:APC family permease [Acidobacteriota bacterium]